MGSDNKMPDKRIVRPRSEGKGDPVKASRSATLSLIFTLAGLVLGALTSSLFSNQEILEEFHAYIFASYYAIAFMSALIILLSIGIFISQAREASRSARLDYEAAQGERFALEQAEVIVRSKVPDLVTFVSRKEKVTVKSNGDGVYFSRHMVRYNGDGDGISMLHFPVVIDIRDESADPGANIRVEYIKVNGSTKSNHAYSPKEIRRPLRAAPQSVMQEYGVVSVPVSLNHNSREAMIEINIVFSKIFGLNEGNYVIIDIPYLTEKLEIAIVPEDKNIELYRKAGEEPIEAICEMMDQTDDIESMHQASNIVEETDRFEWQTRDAKIGYRYKIHFRTVKIAG